MLCALLPHATQTFPCAKTGALPDGSERKCPRGATCMIPGFTPRGDLPPGLYVAAWDELQERFGYK